MSDGARVDGPSIARQRFLEATDAFEEVFYRDVPQDVVRPLTNALLAFSDVMGLATPDTERPDER